MAPGSDPHAPFPTTRIHEVAARVAEQRWLIDQLLASSSVGLVGGPPKAFKTWLAAELALAVAAGVPALGRFAVDEPGPVLFFGAEDPPPDLRVRFEALACARKVDLARVPLSLLEVAALRLDDPGHLDRLRRTVALHAPRLLVLDPFVRLVAGLDENSARDVSAVLGALRTLQREQNVAVLLVHHMRKSPASHPAQQVRGSGDFSAWADAGLYLTRRGDERFLVVEHRNAAAPPPLRLRLVGGTAPCLGIQDCAMNDAAAEDTLEARILELLDGKSRPQPALQLREALRVRKADLLAALHALATRGVVTRTEHGWALAGSLD